jgi:transposase-like protein
MAIETASELDIRIHHLVAPNKCYDFFRAKKWPHGVCFPKCTSNRIKKNGRKRSDPLCQNYKCNNCGCCFNDFTDTFLAKKHHPIGVWIVMLYLMGLPIAKLPWSWTSTQT